MVRAVLLASIWLIACSTTQVVNTPPPPADAGAPDTYTPAAPYSVTLLDHVHIGSDSSKPDFQNALAMVAPLHDAPFATVNLVVDLESPCFPFSKWKTSPPPSGQSWPAECDAFDRNFEMALLDPAAPKGTPGMELVRAITPFGGPEHIEQDVTDVFNVTTTPRTFHVNITTYSDSAGKVSGSNGGWYVSAHLDVTPGSMPAQILAVIPLVYADTTDSNKVTDVPFTLPPSTQAVRLEYRVTGHGGASDPSSACIGPAEEFCKRKHHVFIDDKEIAAPSPWRTDCGKLCTMVTNDPSSPFGPYCQQDPCGAPSSVTASRANWCPGSETPPLTWDQSVVSASPGQHSFSYQIDNVYMGALGGCRRRCSPMPLHRDQAVAGTTGARITARVAPGPRMDEAVITPAKSAAETPHETRSWPVM